MGMATGTVPGIEIAGTGDEVSSPTEPIGRSEARVLTDRIRAATRAVCFLVNEAHERRAWVALGYRSWQQYVQSELSISRSRSYELLDQARVIEELRAAAGMEGIPEVSAYLALQIKPLIPQITQTIRQQVRNASEQEAAAIVANLLSEQRRRFADRRDTSRNRREFLRVLDEDCISHFSDAIDLLTSMPPANRTVELVESTDFPQIERVESAVLWLTTFIEEWRRHVSVKPDRVVPRMRGA